MSLTVRHRPWRKSFDGALGRQDVPGGGSLGRGFDSTPQDVLGSQDCVLNGRKRTEEVNLDLISKKQ